MEYIKIINEIWKNIPGYEGLYEGSNYGRIKSLIDNYKNQRIKILKPGNTRGGYLLVVLCKDKFHKTFPVHKLILETFIGPRPPGMECRHLDGNPKNNRLDNLCWGTHKQNILDAVSHGKLKCHNQNGSKNPIAKLNNWKFRIIKRLLEDGSLTQREIGKIFNVARQTVGDIKNNITWRNI